MKNKILFAILFFATTLIFPQNSCLPTGMVYAQEKASASSANIKSSLSIKEGEDLRVKILKKYLEKHNSPLAPNAKEFVYYADVYNLDWKFVAAISGLESTFGQQIPPDSYNAWGWGIFGDNMIRFNSWSEGIRTISQGLRAKYINHWGANDIYEIGRLYAASPTWAQRVEGFMEDIQLFALNNPQNSLSLSL